MFLFIKNLKFVLKVLWHYIFKTLNLLIPKAIYRIPKQIYEIVKVISNRSQQLGNNFAKIPPFAGEKKPLKKLYKIL
jgi:hypothetical protein